jgi:hypothetical protein
LPDPLGLTPIPFDFFDDVVVVEVVGLEGIDPVPVSPPVLSPDAGLTQAGSFLFL